MKFIATCVDGEYVEESWHEVIEADTLDAALEQLLWKKFADKEDSDAPHTLDEAFTDVEHTDTRFVGCDCDGHARVYVVQVTA